jgi:hypothetical protein
MRQMQFFPISTYSQPRFLVLSTVYCLLSIVYSSCSKEVDITIPAEAEQVVVEGTIETDVPPVVILTKSAKFFDNVNINDLGSYFVRGAQIKITASDGTETDLVELCLQNLNLPPNQTEILLNAFGFSQVDSGQIPDVCVYTVPDIATYYLTGTCSFMGKEATTYALDIKAPGFQNVQDSIHLTASTYIPVSIGIDSLTLREHTNPAYRDSMMAVYGYFSVPDTFGNFARYQTKRNDEPFYKPISGSVYDDRLFVGTHIALPLERGQAPGADFDINTVAYFWKGDTVTVKWSNIDSRTYDFFFTLENDGGDSPFSAPIKIKSNISNGLGVWAGYATQYSTIIIPR